jgi:hypothetical protein
MDIQLVEREVAVGDFSADLVGEEPGSSRAVIIENQLEKTNHDHLGKLLTYAAGKDGGVIIWVAPEIRPEHRDALDWLNRATQGTVDFFGVELELLQIEGSPLKAPNFKVVVAPKSTTPRPSEDARQPSESGQRYHAFFQDVLEQIKERRPGLTRASKLGYGSWLFTPSGRSGFKFGLSFYSRAARPFNIDLYIDTGDKVRNKQAFDLFQMNAETIHKQLGTELDWQRLDNRRASRIVWPWDHPVTIMDSEEKLQGLKVWAVRSYFRFRDVLAPYLANLPSAYEDSAPFDADESGGDGLSTGEPA